MIPYVCMFKRKNKQTDMEAGLESAVGDKVATLGKGCSPYSAPNPKDRQEIPRL